MDHSPSPSTSSGILTEHLPEEMSLQSDDDADEQYDPFDCEEYKLLYNIASGRNIVNLLMERSCCGSFGRRRWVHVEKSERVEEVESPLPSTPVVIGQSNVVGEGYVCYLSPPPHRTTRVQMTEGGDVKVAGLNDNFNLNGAAPSTPINNTNKPTTKTKLKPPPPPNPALTTLHSELISHIEYSSATRFKASYLKHLGGNSNQRIPNSPGGTLNESSMTREQLETQELLRQHLRQEGRNLPGMQGEFPRRLLNPLQRREMAQPHRPLPHNNNRMPNRPNPNPSVSTISISFSPDGRTLASTHGDHSVKITCAHTGKLIRSLEGHPRTPWTVKYHPTNNHIVASGCLGFQVRVWDWNYRTEAVRGKWRRENERRYGGRYTPEPRSGRCSSPRGVMEGNWRNGRKEKRREGGEDDYAASCLEELGIPKSDPAWYDISAESFNYHDGIGVCLNMIRLNHAIISLAFHPSGEVLAVASGSTLHLWDYDEEGRKMKKKRLSEVGAASDVSRGGGSSQPQRVSESRLLYRDRNSDFPSSRTLNISHESALRCVHFPPNGTSLIIGGVNPTSANEGLSHRHTRGRGGMSGGGMSFHLRLWDFDLEAVLNPSMDNDSVGGQVNVGNMLANSLGGMVSDEGEVTWNFTGVRRPLNNPRIIIPRVLLYNDGGFDLSKDGKILSACAEYWLPEGIDNAMELLHNEQELDEAPEEAMSETEEISSKTPACSRPASPTPDATSGNQENYTTPSSIKPSFSILSDPRTPPPNSNFTSLEPPPPPGNRNLPRVYNLNNATGPGSNVMTVTHNPHPLSLVAPNHPAYESDGGRYVPHIVTINMDTSPPLRETEGKINLTRPIIETESMRRHPQLGQLLNAAPLDGAKASGVTCVKLSPSAEYCLLGYGVRDNLPSTNGNDPRHPVTAMYNVNKGMLHVSTLTSIEDDVNIARFHPESGHGFVYGTKQGRVRILSTRPWNHYHL